MDKKSEFSIEKSRLEETGRSGNGLTCKTSPQQDVLTTLALTFGPKQSTVCQLGQIFVDESVWKSLKSPPALKGCNKQ